MDVNFCSSYLQFSLAYSQRGANKHPFCLFVKEGGFPFIPTGNLPSSFGMAFIKAFVYGCFGLFKTISLYQYYTIVPP